MAVASRHILQQVSPLRALGRTALGAARQSLVPGRPRGRPEAPGPVVQETAPPLGAALVDDYIRHIGGDPGDYRDTVPPHLFPQWTFEAAGRTLSRLPYPLARVVNGGLRVETRGPIPRGAPLRVTAQLVEIEERGRRAVLKQRITTGPERDPEALVVDLRAVVPLASGRRKARASDDEPARDRRERPAVPADARRVGAFAADRWAGLDFAKLTGDFNPIHWVRPYAVLSGFPTVILHGFSTVARTMEALRRAEGRELAWLDARLTKPLCLPCAVGIYVKGDEVYVGDDLGGAAYLTGRFAHRGGGV